MGLLDGVAEREYAGIARFGETPDFLTWGWGIATLRVVARASAASDTPGRIFQRIAGIAACVAITTGY